MAAESCWICFENCRRIDDLDILWIDEDGNEKHYTKISPGRSHTQHTYVGHRWMVRAALCGKAPRNGQALLSFVGRSGIQRLKIPDPDHSGTASSALVSGAVEDFMGGGEMGHSSDQRGEMLSEDGVEEHAAEGSGLVSVFRFSNDMEKALSVTWETRTGEKMGEDAARGLLVRPGETLEATAPADAFAVVCTEAGDYVCTCAGAAPSAAHHRISYDPALLESGSRQPVPNVHNYESVTVQGFQVFLAEDVRDRERIMRALSQDLGEVRRLLPPQALSVISDARLYFNGKYHYGLERKRGMCVHWSADWLRSIGDLPEKAGHIECYCADEYLNTTRPEQPACILHELSHCYHQRRLDAIDEMISDAYCKAIKTGKYDSVKHVAGNMVQHYAKNNHFEYFAECTEAFFSSSRFRNDYFPFVHEELKAYDKEGFAMVARAWNVQDDSARALCLHRKLGGQLA